MKKIGWTYFSDLPPSSSSTWIPAPFPGMHPLRVAIYTLAESYPTRRRLYIGKFPSKNNNILKGAFFSRNDLRICFFDRNTRSDNTSNIFSRVYFLNGLSIAREGFVPIRLSPRWVIYAAKEQLLTSDGSELDYIRSAYILSTVHFPYHIRNYIRERL